MVLDDRAGLSRPICLGLGSSTRSGPAISRGFHCRGVLPVRSSHRSFVSVCFTSCLLSGDFIPDDRSGSSRPRLLAPSVPNGSRGSRSAWRGSSGMRSRLISRSTRHCSASVRADLIAAESLFPWHLGPQRVRSSRARSISARRSFGSTSRALRVSGSCPEWSCR